MLVPRVEVPDSMTLSVSSFLSPLALDSSALVSSALDSSFLRFFVFTSARGEISAKPSVTVM